MTGRGRGRGALARWEASKSVGENTTRVGSPISMAVFPLSPKESWEDEIKKIQEDTTRDDRVVRVTHIIDVENFWAQIGKLIKVDRKVVLSCDLGRTIPNKKCLCFPKQCVLLFPTPRRTRKTSDSQVQFGITFDLCSLFWEDELIDHELTFTSRSILKK